MQLEASGLHKYIQYRLKCWGSSSSITQPRRGFHEYFFLFLFLILIFFLFLANVPCSSLVTHTGVVLLFDVNLHLVAVVGHQLKSLGSSREIDVFLNTVLTVPE